MILDIAERFMFGAAMAWAAFVLANVFARILFGI